MSRSLIALTLTALTLTATTALAQDDTTTETPTAQAPLDMGQPIEQGPALGQRYVKEKHGDWTLTCIKTQAEVDPCSLVQVLVDETSNPVAEVSLFRLEGGQATAGATVIVPLETYLPGQLTIAVDGGTAKRYNYQFCNQIGCIAQIGLTQDDVNAYKAGAKATVTLIPAPAPDRPIILNMSLNGFTAGYDVVDVVKN